jgi:glycosyltransferase involved in cell wall biosynthesis
VHVVPGGVPPALATPPEDERAIAARLELPDRYVLAVGTVEPRKGLPVLVDAMSRPQAPDVPLVVVGPQGWGGLDLHTVAASHGLAPGRLRVLGRLTDPELATVLHRAGVLAAPSFAEGFGLPVVEAMAAGVPVVHSDAPALVEVAGGTGTTVGRGDPAALAAALRDVLADPGRAAASVAAARQRAARFTWRRAAEQIWRLHLELYRARRAGS